MLHRSKIGVQKTEIFSSNFNIHNMVIITNIIIIDELPPNVYISIS